MSHRVVIKQGGDFAIVLEETRRTHPKVIWIAIGAIIFITCISALRLILFNDIVGYCLFSIVGSSVIVIIAGTLGKIDYYTVSVYLDNYKVIFVEKTNVPNVDQKNICAASKKLENLAIKYLTRQLSLKALADGCK